MQETGYQWAPDLDYDEATGEKTVPPNPVNAVYQAIGAATSPSMWGEDGVFQEQSAIAIAEGLIAYLRAHPLAVVTP